MYYGISWYSIVYYCIIWFRVYSLVKDFWKLWVQGIRSYSMWRGSACHVPTKTSRSRRHGTLDVWSHPPGELAQSLEPAVGGGESFCLSPGRAVGPSRAGNLPLLGPSMFLMGLKGPSVYTYSGPNTVLEGPKARPPYTKRPRSPERSMIPKGSPLIKAIFQNTD